MRRTMLCVMAGLLLAGCHEGGDDSFVDSGDSAVDTGDSVTADGPSDTADTDTAGTDTVAMDAGDAGDAGCAGCRRRHHGQRGLDSRQRGDPGRPQSSD